MLGYRSKRVTLALAPFFFFTRRVYTAGRVTLASGLPYLPCKRSARDNSPTLDNFPPLTRVIGNPACELRLKIGRGRGEGKKAENPEFSFRVAVYFSVRTTKHALKNSPHF